jgi:UPF0716 protein FxsA
MLVALVLLICWPVAEIYVAIKIGEAIGALLTVLLLFAGWPLGSWLLRSQGRAAWGRLTTAIAEGRPPAREVADGALVVVGGALLIIPGFISDAIGLWLVFPPTRALMRIALVRNFRSAVVVQAARFSRRPYDVDSTARDVENPKLRP